MTPDNLGLTLDALVEELREAKKIHAAMCDAHAQAIKRAIEAEARIKELESRKYVCGNCNYHGMGDEYTEWVEKLEAERDTLRAELEGARKVVEAARNVRAVFDHDSSANEEAVALTKLTESLSPATEEKP